VKPRIPLLKERDAVRAADDVGVAEIAARLNVFRAWLHHPPLAKWLHDLIMGLLWQGKLDRRLRELIIMRLGWTTGSVYEWTQHWRIATELLEIPGDDLLAAREWQTSDRFGDAERAVLQATDDVVSTGAISADTWSALTRHISSEPAVLLEIPACIATWHAVSVMLRSLEVPLEDGVAAWPPDGLAPH
jgi:alkylhydroperoxidase family enzyme